jgi:Tol biopolymer transport system component
VVTAPPQPLTRLGGCAYYPAFLDDGTVAFEWSRGEDRRRLYLLPLAGGAPTRLTSGVLTESDVGPGRRPGELLYRVEDELAAARVGASHLVLRDRATGAETSVDVATASAVAAGDAIYYARLDQGEIRRWRAQTDEVFLTVPGDQTVGRLAASPDNRWLAMASVAHGSAPHLCLVNLIGPPRLHCLTSLRPIRGRAVFSPDARVLYYPAADGIHRVDIQTEHDETAVPGVFAPAGLALSAAADALAFSDCAARGPLLDLSRSPPVLAVDEDLPRQPAAGPNGLLTYVRERRGQYTLVMRDAQGTARQLTKPDEGSPSAPSFDPTGRWIAFEIGGTKAPGIYVVDAAGQYPPERVTAGAQDNAPIWTADGRLVFTRWDDQQNPSVMLVDRTGGTPERAPLPSRKTVAHALGTGELLLESKDKEQLFLWKPGHGPERRVPLGPLAGSYFMASGIAPDGRFLVVQTGASGRTVWRLWLDGSARPPERLFAARGDQSMSSVALTSDGRILVGVRSWSGELHLVRAPAGARF